MNNNTRHKTELGPGSGEKLPSRDSLQDFPGGPVVKNLPANAGDTGLIPGMGRSHMPRSI